MSEVLMRSGFFRNVFNVHAYGVNQYKINRANRAFEGEQIRVRIENQRIAIENERIAAEKKAAEHSARIKMGMAIRKAHDERGLPPMSRRERKTALDFAMATNEIHKAADKARENIRSVPSLAEIRAEIAREKTIEAIKFHKQIQPPVNIPGLI